MIRNFSIGFGLIAVLLLFSGLASAQDPTGAIVGRVMDATGAVVPGVTVIVRSPALQGTRQAITAEGGAYQFRLLPPGVYTVTFELPGFRTLVREGIILELQRTVTLDAGLEVAAGSETVTVTGESPVIDVQNATVGVNFSQSMLRDLPNSRDIWIVLAQTPGVVTTRPDVGGSSMGSQTPFRAYGMSGQNWYTLDGIVSTQGGGNAGWYWDYGAFQEIQVSAAANAAEVPVAGAYMNTIVKTGGNRHSGMAYIDYEGEKFQGNNVSAEMTRKCVAGQTGPCGKFTGDKFVVYNDVNLNLGGPIKQDKLWYFLSWRNYYTKFNTELRHNDGTPGAPYTTLLRNPTVKLSWQATAKDSFTTTLQMSRKIAPYRGGQGPNAAFFVQDATGNQRDPSIGYKFQWTRVVSPKATLEVSATNSGYTFPLYSRTKELARRDLVTQQVRGSYSGQSTGFTTAQPFVNSPGHYNYRAYLSYFQDDFLGGTHNFKVGYDYFWEVNRTFNLGPEGQLVLYFRDGVPDQIQTYNSPFHTVDSLGHHAMFAQDTWRIGRKLTMNIGVRFDRYHSYIPDQQNEGIGPYAQPFKVQKTDLATFNNTVPRISLVYNVFGSGKTAVKASYGRFAWNPATTISRDANPNTAITKRYRWNGTLPFVPSNAVLLSTSGGGTRAIDPNLKNTFTDEFTAGLDQQIAADFGFRINFVRKIESDRIGRVNAAQDPSYYTPVQFIDPGPDSVLGGSDDRTITVFSIRPDRRGLVQDVVRTFEGVGHNYSTIEVQGFKRLSNGWQFLTGADWIKRNLARNLTYDPNDLNYGLSSPSGGSYWEWSYKLMGTYEFPYGLNLSSVYKAQKGETYSRRLNVAGLNQGTITINAEPAGSSFYPSLHLWDARVEKRFRLGDTQSIDAIFDLFNITNRNTVIGFNTLTGSNFGRQITQTLNPRIARIAFRYTF